MDGSTGTNTSTLTIDNNGGYAIRRQGVNKGLYLGIMSSNIALGNYNMSGSNDYICIRMI